MARTHPPDKGTRLLQGNMEDAYGEEQAEKAARAAAAAEEGGEDGRTLTKKERTALEKAAAQVPSSPLRSSGAECGLCPAADEQRVHVRRSHAVFHSPKSRCGCMMRVGLCISAGIRVQPRDVRLADCCSRPCVSGMWV